MTSHVHLIISTTEMPMENILRDLKSFTSTMIKKAIEDNPQESRKEWMLWMMKRVGAKNSNNADFQFWQQNNHSIELWNNYMMQQKLDYIHNNPVAAGFVSEPQSYIYSSARDYAVEKGLLQIKLIR